MSVLERVVISLDKIANEGLLWMTLRASRRGIRKARPLLIVLAMSAFMVAGFWFVPLWILPVSDELSDRDRFEQLNSLRVTLVQVVGAGALIGGVFYTARTYRLNQLGSVTDRYSRAIDHLAQGTESARAGGVLELAMMAANSNIDKEWIVRALDAFVVDRTSSREAPDARASVNSGYALRLALIVLAEYNTPLRLTGADLRGIELSNLYLVGADLRSANLENADLSEARLSDSDLTGANLGQADLRGAILRNARLVGANFDQAEMKRAQLAGATVTKGALSDRQLMSIDGVKSVVWSYERQVSIEQES